MAQERLLDKPMGLFAQDDRLYLNSRYQIWQFDDLLGPGETRQGCDRRLGGRGSLKLPPGSVDAAFTKEVEGELAALMGGESGPSL